MGWPAMALNTNGSREVVTPWRMITSQNRLAENLGCNTTVPPTPSTLHIDQLCALT